ncbi:MAG: delta-lactam-biosynthetic de-N-acetylase [Clostridiaceae bacterium]
MKKFLISFLITILSFTFISCNKDNSIDKLNNKKGDTPQALEVNTSNDAIKSNEENKKSHAKSISDEEAEILSKQASLSNKTCGWGFERGLNGSLPNPGKEYSNLLSKYDGYYHGDTTKKVLYLTFDSGYENGNTSKILDILKENDVKATFFVTTPYVKKNKELILRMVEEGHIVGNHTTTHPSMPSIKEFSKFKYEFEALEKLYKEVTNKEMKKFFRPPMGQFSESTLYKTKKLGYKSIFWSFAYSDWDQDHQPSKEAAIKIIKDNMHNGEILLLHSVSKTNTEILDEMIKYWKEEGYEIKSLEDL